MSETLETKVQRIQVRNKQGDLLAEPTAFCIGGLAAHVVVLGHQTIPPEYVKRPQYTISHIGTGLKLGHLVGTLDQAIAFMRDISGRYHLTGTESRQTLQGMIALKQEILRLQSFAEMGGNFFQVPQWECEVSSDQFPAGQALAFKRGR